VGAVEAPWRAAMAVWEAVGARGVARAGGSGLGGRVVGAVTLSTCSLSKRGGRGAAAAPNDMMWPWQARQGLQQVDTCERASRHQKLCADRSGG
jgi:hypothetical protein